MPQIPAKPSQPAQPTPPDLHAVLTALARQIAELNHQIASHAPEPSLDREAASRYLAVSPATLKLLDLRGKGPTAVRIGKRWTYLRRDLDAWRERLRVDPSLLDGIEEAL